jgi:hypothetical protein
MAEPVRLSRSRFASLYWTLAQMVAHQWRPWNEKGQSGYPSFVVGRFLLVANDFLVACFYAVHTLTAIRAAYYV